MASIFSAGLPSWIILKLLVVSHEVQEPLVHLSLPMHSILFIYLSQHFQSLCTRLVQMSTEHICLLLKLGHHGKHQIWHRMLSAATRTEWTCMWKHKNIISDMRRRCVAFSHHHKWANAHAETRPSLQWTQHPHSHHLHWGAQAWIM